MHLARSTLPLAIAAFALLAGRAAAEPTRVTMADAADRALKASYSLVAINKRLTDAQSYLDRSSAWLATNPFVSGGAAASSDRFFTDSGPGQPPGRETFGPSYTFTLQQDLEVAGQRGKRMAAARRGLEVVESEHRSTAASIRAEAQKAFTAALASDANLALTQRSTELIEQLNAEFDAQPARTAERIAFNASTIQMLRQRQRRDSARRARDDAYRELKRITGIPLDLQIVLEGTLEARPRVLPPYGELLAGVGDRRADVAAYRGLVARADADLALARRSAIPDVSIFAFVSRFDSAGTTETSGGGSLGFTLPIFQDIGPGVDDAVNERQRAAAELADLMVLVESHLATAYALAKEAATDLTTVSDEILPRARENVALQQERVHLGEVRPYDAVDYQLELITAEQELVTAQRVYTDALIDLEKAAALPLWQPETDSARTPETAGDEQQGGTQE